MKSFSSKMSMMFVVTTLVVGIAAGGALAGGGKVVQKGAITSYTASTNEANASNALDYKNAIPMPMPTLNFAPIRPSEGEVVKYPGQPNVAEGVKGTVKTNLLQLLDEDEEITFGEDEVSAFSEEVGIDPQEHGTSNHVFTTSRVDLDGRSESGRYPNRAVGKLYFKIGASTYMCSASLIKKGVIVTAAHCVANYGKKQMYSNWQFIPALYDATRPYYTWNAASVALTSVYYNGTDSCAAGASGVVCRNDIAVIRLVPQVISGVTRYPGYFTGWLGYGWNGWGFANNQALINQLGYPASHDSGLRMQRTDSEGFVSSSLAGNTVWGGRQTGGSSGGPEVVNLGPAATLSGGVSFGSYATRNIVVGVTSWGYTNQAIKQQGASPFTSGNIVPLVNAVCAGVGAAACAP